MDQPTNDPLESSTDAIAPENDMPKPSQPSPFNCISGSAIAGGMAFGLYLLTTSIAGKFAAKPIITDNPLTQNISSLVRTSVVGVSALGTGVFGMVALGLFALGIQILLKGDRQPSA